MEIDEDGHGGVTDNFLWGAECPEEDGEEEDVGGMMSLDECDDDDARSHVLPDMHC